MLRNIVALSGVYSLKVMWHTARIVFGESVGVG